MQEDSGIRYRFSRLFSVIVNGEIITARQGFRQQQENRQCAIRPIPLLAPCIAIALAPVPDPKQAETFAKRNFAGICHKLGMPHFQRMFA